MSIEQKMNIPINNNPIDLAITIAEAVKSVLNRQESILLDAKKAAEFIGIGRTTWYQLYSENKTPNPIRLNKRVLWKKQELICWSEAGCPNRYNWEKIQNQI